MSIDNYKMIVKGSYYTNLKNNLKYYIGIHKKKQKKMKRAK